MIQPLDGLYHSQKSHTPLVYCRVEVQLFLLYYLCVSGWQIEEAYHSHQFYNVHNLSTFLPVQPRVDVPSIHLEELCLQH